MICQWCNREKAEPAPPTAAPLPHAVELKREHDWITGATPRVSPERVSVERLKGVVRELQSHDKSVTPFVCGRAERLIGDLWDEIGQAETERDDARAQLAEAQRERDEARRDATLGTPLFNDELRIACERAEAAEREAQALREHRFADACHAYERAREAAK